MLITDFRKLIYGSLITFSLNPIIFFFGFLWNMILTRILTPFDVGRYSLCITIFGILAAISNLGIDSFLFRHYPLLDKNTDIKGRRFLLLISIFFPFLSGILSGTFIFIFRYKINDILNTHLDNLLNIFLIALPFYTVSYSLIKALLAEGYAFRAQLVNLLSTRLIPFSILLSLLKFKKIYNVNDVALIYSISVILMFIVSIYWVNKYVCSFKGPFDKIFTIKEIFAFSIPIMFSSLFSIMFLWSDNLMLGILSSSDNVAYYNMSYLLSAMIKNFSLLAIQTLLLPILMKYYGESKNDNIVEVYGITSRLAFLISVPIALFFIIYRKEMLVYIFGNKYIIGHRVLEILSIMFLIRVSIGPISTIAIAYAKTPWIMISTFIVLILNVLGNYILIPLIGIAGAALCTGSSEILSAILILFKLPIDFIRQFNKNIYRYVINLFIASCIFYGSKLFYNDNLVNFLFSGILCTLIFYIIISKSPAISKSDKELFKKLIKNLKN